MRSWTLVLLVVVGRETWAEGRGIAGYSGKAGPICSQCHAAQSGAPVTATITGPATVESGREARYELRLTGRTSGKAGADIASVDGVVLIAGNSQLRELGPELVHRSPSSFTDPAFADGGVVFPFRLIPNVDAGTRVTVYAAAQWVGGTGSAAPARVHAITFPIDVVAPNLPPSVVAGPTFELLDGGTSGVLRVTASDDKPATGLTYSWSARDAGVLFSPNGTNAAQQSTATFPRAGTYALDVRVVDAVGAATTGSVLVNVSPVFRSIRLTPPSATVQFGSTQSFGASARDQFGEPLGLQPPFTWAVSDAGTISSTGVFSAGPIAASGIVTATSSGIVGRGTVTVAAGAPPTLSNTTAVVRGRTVALSTMGSDDTGESGLTYTWTATGPAPVMFSPNATNSAKASTATLTRAGDYVFTVEARDVSGFSATASVTRTIAPTLTSLSLTPARVTLRPAATHQFTLVQRDQFDRPMPTASTVSWAAYGSGSVGSNGLYTAGTTLGGPFQVRATIGSLSQAADVTISSGDVPFFSRAATAQPASVFGKTTQLRALADDANGEAALLYTWTAEGPAAVTFSVNGTNAAKTTQATFSATGTYRLTVTAQNALTRTASSTVEVTVEASAELVELTPARVWLAPGRSQRFSARSIDQFGAPMSDAETTWRAVLGGSIDDTGLFIADEVEGTFEVTAGLAGRFGTASVLIDGTAPSVSLKGLLPRATVRGNVTLEATVVEAGELESVTFLVNGAAVGQVTKPPFSVTWDSTAMADGRVTVEARAIDAAGNVATSGGLEVAVWNDPRKPSPYTFEGGCSSTGGLSLVPLLTLLAWARRRRAVTGGRS